MKRILSWCLSAPVLGTLGVAALCAVVWWLGPLLAFGTGTEVHHPLAGVAPRAALVGLMALAWAAWLAWGWWRRRQAIAALLQGLTSRDSAADQEAGLLAQRFADAVSRLRAPQSGWRRALTGHDALYELPWYVFIGAPGSGKTTALLQAGLPLLLTEGQATVKGVGGTRNCDWWFTQDAVLIDTAGRYATQDSDHKIDAAAWDRFLGLLRRHRPRQPINGVLLTVSVQDLLQLGTAERQQQAAQLRERLRELGDKLQVRAPVYVMVTKADLLGGFVETFDALGTEDREQVWGFTLPWPAADAADPLAGFDAEFQALEQRLVSGQLEKLQDERDVARRAGIFTFPQEFAALRRVLGEHLRQIFPGGATAGAPLVRGVYFTSGTQEGTPIDRVVGSLVRSFGLERRRPAATAPGRGKSFFLRRLMQDVVFGEAHLVTLDPAAQRRRRLLRVTGFAAVGLSCAVVASGWIVSHSRNRAYVQQVEQQLPALRQSLQALPAGTGADIASLAQPLAAVRDAARTGAFDVDAPPWLNTLGLYQGDLLDAGARQSYERLLRHTLLPSLAARLAERLRAVNRNQLELAYEALKAYRMLHAPQHFDPVALKAWIGMDWDVQFAQLPAARRAELDRHLDALLALGAPSLATPQDPALVAGVRDMLASFPLEYRVYNRLKSQSRGEIPEFSVATHAGPNAARVFQRASGEPLARGVPGFFTREGYAKAFQARVAATAEQLAREESWVLERAAGTARPDREAGGDALAERVRRLYLQDYIRTWDAFLADVKVAGMGSLEQSVAVAQLLAGVDSPLVVFLKAVAAETTLAGATGGTPAGAAVDAAADRAKAELARRLGAPAAPAPAAAGPVEKQVDDHFAPIHRLLQGQPAPIEELQKAMADLHLHLQAVESAQKTRTPPPAGGGAAAKAAAARLPEPARSIVASLAEAGERQGRAAEREALSGDLKPIFEFCSRAIANRYPFAPTSRADVLPEDFGQLFGVGGLLDEFFQRRLAPLVDTSGATWAYKPLVDGTRPARPASLLDFQRAARIRDAFFRGGGKQPSFRIEVKVVDLGGLPELTLDIDGQVQRLVAGGPSITLSWPGPRVSSQIRLSAGSGAGVSAEGPWALFRLFDRFEVQPSSQPEKFSLLVVLDGRRARLDVTASSVLNPFRMREMQQFQCPGAL